MIAPTSTHFDLQYQAHLKHLKLKGLQPKTIEAYARAIRRIGEYFDHQIDNLTEPQRIRLDRASAASHDLGNLTFKRLRGAGMPTDHAEDSCRLHDLEN